MSKLWNLLGHSAAWDVIKALLRSLGVSAMIASIFVVIRQWYNQPAGMGTALVMCAVSTVAFTAAWIMNRRLEFLEPRIEDVSQNRASTFFKRIGHDAAVVLPVKNSFRWWHSGLSSLQALSAHIEYFLETGELVQAAYSAMWINEESPFVHLEHGETKSLIIALQDFKGRSSSFLFVPEAGAISKQPMKDVLEAYDAGRMLALKHLLYSPSLVVKIILSAPGYNRELWYRLRADGQNGDFWLEPLKIRPPRLKSVSSGTHF